MRRAFTLIELLVVIAIIAILAAILFPVFAQAKQAAKKTQDLSNMKQIGTSIQIYLADYDDTYSQAYYYPNDSGSSTNGNGVGGYVQWSGLLQPYTKNLQIFVSPGDPNGGLAPTCYVGNNLGYGAPAGQTPQASCSTIQDVQAPRISYTANSLLMPRKRRTIDPMSVTSSTAVDDVSGTILLAAQTHFKACINGISTASNEAFKTHRPANGILLQNGNAFAGEDPAEVGLGWYRALTVAQAKSDLAACKAGTNAGPAGFSHITYAQPDRWGKGSNYTYADTHAKFASLEATLNPENFQWGKRAYTAGGGEVRKADGLTPVN
ncbi:MAG: prepilin-type N-terminal cleavage/methylation domain-containing protein [Fimbriimonadaceae bacterium]|nr:prepilin-type N-terminal cleavage/methylation domain-containing protein [Fimbriimonadaceae bacterium]